MQITLSRRQFVPALSGVAGAGAMGFFASPARAQTDLGAGMAYPSTEPSLAKSIVGLAHRSLDGVLALLKEDPQLALAGWDWGFGDWESALGAASHVGRREIAEVLIEHGARPNVFTFAMLDQVDTVRAICKAMPGIQSALGPHGIPLLSHARPGKADRVRAYLESLGGADPDTGTIALSAQESEIYLGLYAYGSSASERLECSRHRTGGIGLTGPSGMFRMIHAKGGHTFRPAGAARLPIVFDVEDGVSVRVTIHHNSALVVAERVAN